MMIEVSAISLIFFESSGVSACGIKLDLGMSDAKISSIQLRSKRLSSEGAVALCTPKALARALSLMKTNSGLQLVMDTLGRIEHGIVA